MRALQRLTLGVCCAAATALSGQAASAHPDVLNIVSWGGTYTASQMRAYVNPYRDTTEQPVQVDRYAGGLDEIEAQVEAENVKWDVVDVGLSNAIRGCREGLFEKIDHSQLPATKDGTPASEDFREGMLPECAVGQNVFSNVIAYHTERWPNVEPPDSAEAFFNTTKYKGRRGMRRNPRGNLELALIADGVAPDEVYDVLSTEQGLQRAFNKLRSIAPSIVWWEDAGAPSQLLEKEKVAMTTGFNGRLQRSIENKGKPFEIIWDGQTMDYELWTIVKGSPHKEAAMDFIKFASQPLRQAAQANFIYYGPARKSAMGMVQGTLKELLPTAEDNMQTAVRINHDWWAENQKELNKRFDRFVESAKSMAGTQVFGVGTAR
jgi:putative spermidine/putrescine transport system substrate-binding protein